MRCEASFQNGTLGKTWRRDERRFAISAPCCRDLVDGRGIYIPTRHYVVVTLLNSHICTASTSLGLNFSDNAIYTLAISTTSNTHIWPYKPF